VTEAARRGGFGKPIAIQRIEAVAGPRAGALEILAGMDSGRLLRVLAQDDAALLRQFVPWPFAGRPLAYMAGRYVRLEAGWPKHLAETLIRLRDLGSRPCRNGRWVFGRNEYGQTVIGGLDDRRPHYLFGGTTGSGKSVALQGMVLQLSRDPGNQLVLVDGKWGEGLRQVASLPGVVGPLATDAEQARAALGWACCEMRRRYEAGQHEGRIVVVFDEFQELAADQAIAAMLCVITAKGRAAGIHMIAATHHPKVDAFGDSTTRRNLPGRLALRVGDFEASRVAVGASTPRADYLHGRGDAYAVAPGAIQRVQVAYVDRADFDAVSADGRRSFDEWPAFDAEALGQEPPQVGRTYSPDEVAVSLEAALDEAGRPALKERLETAGLGRPGSSRAAALLEYGRRVHGVLTSRGVVLVRSAG